jgi:hypothetical protein
LLLFVIIAEKWEFEFVVGGMGVFVLWWCGFAGGDIRKDFVDIDDELDVDDWIGGTGWTSRRFWCCSLSIGSNLTLRASIDVVLSNCWCFVAKSSFVKAEISSKVSALER